jgi:prolyl-tRNA editing enzyme YbaK/EbsC (Cys-tRNA(Pro) deacylase)/RimJ/RimL family protein N-acetyltransferase
MAIERVKDYFRALGMESRVWEFDTSSATVELAAQTLGVRPARIAKTLSFALGEGCVLLVAAGDARIDNRKYKDQFQTKASMLAHEDVERLTGSAVGGVCPFALPQAAPVYLDVSLKRFSTVFPACGSDNSAMELSCDELFRYSHAKGWVDVCKDWEAGDDPTMDDEPHPELPMPSDGELTLHVASASDADETTGHVAAYVFDLVRVCDGAVVGETRLRLGYVRNVYYGGNVGYTVLEEYRGHGYAEKAVRLLFEIARAHRMPYIIISCEQTNEASRKTLEHLHGTLLETVVPPQYTGLWQKGVQGEVCIFRFDL